MESCFYHQSHSQLGVVLLWLHPFILSGVISPLISSSILGTYWTGEFILQCPNFLPFHTVHGIVKERILKWFVIPFSNGPHSVRPLHYDLSWVAPYSMAEFHQVIQSCGPCDQIGYLSVTVVSVCLPPDPFSQCLPSFLGFSYLGHGVRDQPAASQIPPRDPSQPTGEWFSRVLHEFLTHLSGTQTILALIN